MEADAIEPVEVFLGSHKAPQQALFGPLPGRRLGNVVTYEMQAPQSFEPWPGRSRVERKCALLEVGVSFGVPCWASAAQTDGTVIVILTSSATPGMSIWSPLSPSLTAVLCCATSTSTS